MLAKTVIIRWAFFIRGDIRMVVLILFLVTGGGGLFGSAKIKSKFQRKNFFRSTPGQMDGVLGSTLTCKYLSSEA